MTRSLFAWLFLNAIALAPGLSIAAVGDVSIVAGTDEPVNVVAAESKQVWYRLGSVDDHLSIVAEGPVVLALRLRVLSEGTARGVLRLSRDAEAISDNPYELVRDPPVRVEAKGVEDAVSKERLLHVRVPEGVHHYELSSHRSPPVIVRVTRTKTYQPARGVVPERSVVADVEPSEPVIVASDELDEIPQVAMPAISWGAAPEKPTVANPALLPAELAFELQPETAYVRTKGLAIALRAGGWHFFDSSAVSPSASLELAWDVTPEWSVSFDGAFAFTGSVSDSVVVPVGLGAARFIALGETFGIRLKLLAEGAWVDSVRRSGFRAGLMPAVGVEAKAGPGQVSLEARGLWLGTRFDLADAPMLDATPLWGVGALVGYRFAL